jgi:hypothetical protein
LHCGPGHDHIVRWTKLKVRTDRRAPMSANGLPDQRLVSDASAGEVLERVPELTAAQYVILAESQRKKRALAETRVKYNALVLENKQLLEERAEAEKTAFEVRV